MKFLIINADDFGYSFGVNRGIIEAHVDGVVTSTSVLVNRIAAGETAGLAKYPELSVGLHFDLSDPNNTQAELLEQIEKFKSLTGKMPSHIDVHKILNRGAELEGILQMYSDEHKIPVRQLGFAKFIDSYHGPHSDGVLSVAQFRLAISQATDQYNEIMCHPGYCDDYLLKNSAYSRPREQELKTLCDPSLKNYIAQKDLKLANWYAINQISKTQPW